MNLERESIKLKEKQAKKLAEDILKSKTIMIVSIKSLPSKQFQEIKKSLRDHANIKVAKKNIIMRALSETKKESIFSLKDYLKPDCAIMLSNMEGYELARMLARKKTPVFAKAGQEVPEDIEVKAGPTDLAPGPAISELGAQGIQIAVEEGKIAIKADKIIANKGKTITAEVASLLQKLNIQPFKVGLDPVVIYDNEKEKIYTEINIDPEGFAEELKKAVGKSLGFAQKIAFYCRETIGYLLAKANSEAVKLDSLKPTDAPEVSREETEVGSEEKLAEETKEEQNNAQLNKPEEEA